MARAKTLKLATEHMTEYFASCLYRDALRSRNRPDVLDVHVLPLGSTVRVYRPEVDKWEAHFKLLSLSDGTCTLLVPTALRGYSEFRATVVKPYIPPVPAVADSTSQSPTANMSSPARSDPPATKGARTKQLEGLFANGVFDAVHASEAGNNRLYGTRFLDEVRIMGTPDEYTRSRLRIERWKRFLFCIAGFLPLLLQIINSAIRENFCFLRIEESVSPMEMQVEIDVPKGR